MSLETSSWFYITKSKIELNQGAKQLEHNLTELTNRSKQKCNSPFYRDLKFCK